MAGFSERNTVGYNGTKGKKDPNLELAEAISQFTGDPLGFVIFAFPWDTDKSIQQVKLPEKYRDRFNTEYGPDLWACEYLDELGEHIRDRAFDGESAVMPIQMATSSGHGIGKSALVAWIILFIMCTRKLCNGVVTANTAEQLRTKTWAEVGKWHKRCVAGHWFEYTSGRGAMSLYHKEHPKEWKVNAQTSREENSEAFAGLHAANSTPFYIFDEASGIPEKIFEVREGGTTDGEPMVFDFGNPTRNSGRFYEECVGKFRRRWSYREIDSRSVQITNKDRIDEWIEDYGEDSDFVKVRVKGVFPSAGSLQFIPTEDVESAMGRQANPDRTQALAIGVDVARQGDDESVIYPRLGNDARSFEPRRFSGLDTVQMASKVIDCINEFRAMGVPIGGVFVDGGGIGAGVVDQLRHTGYNPIEVQFGSRPGDPRKYRFKVDEMWGRMKEAIRLGLALPSEGRISEEIKTQLTQREFGFTLKDQINLETKKDMKARGISSPDIIDALALTYAQELAPLEVPFGVTSHRFVKSDYDPLQAV